MYMFHLHVLYIYIYIILYISYMYTLYPVYLRTGLMPVPPPTVGARARSEHHLLNHKFPCCPSGVVQNIPAYAHLLRSMYVVGKKIKEKPGYSFLGR
jgi:hypothetical protein